MGQAGASHESLEMLQRDNMPLFVMRPRSKWLEIDLPQLWEYRDLFVFLVWRDILVRYKQTLLGAAWAIIQPLAGMVVFTLFFGRLAKIPSDGIPYPLFSYSALLLWQFFANSVSQSANSLVGARNLITKIYFPRVTLPVAPVLAGLLDLAIAGSLLLIMFWYYSIWSYQNLWAVPIFIVIAAMTATGVGLWLSALNVKYRDFRYVVPFLIQFWMFASPVVYPASLLDEKWRIVYGLNPMVGAIEGFRWALLNTETSPFPIAYVSLISSLLVMVTGLFYFQRTEDFFADLI